MKYSESDLFKKLIAHAKEYGFVFPSSEIYDGLGAVYDYGQNGVELKNNIKRYWWESMVHLHENIVGIDSAIFMHPKIWEASGHVNAFNDLLVDNKDSKKRYKADILIEEHISKCKDKIKKKIMQARFLRALNDCNLEELRKILFDYHIICPVSGTDNWTDIRQFNLMFSSKMGFTKNTSVPVYLRPETAQGIFVNFLNIQKTSRMKIPFGIAQIGKAFRNEIIARQFIFRMREFEQMEMQFFVRPGEELVWFEKWKEIRMNWHKDLGMGDNNYRFFDHDKLAHYANAATDIEFRMPFGFREIEGIHSRTNFDLSNHEKFSGKKMRFFDPEVNQSYIPFVIETSLGLDRMFLSILTSAYTEENKRVVLKLPPVLAPVQLAIFPLEKKNQLPEMARKIFDDFKFDFHCFYDEKDSIGKRYRRQDAIGTPFCVTIDYNRQVTLRNRDTMLQNRISVDHLCKIINEFTSLKWLFKKNKLKNKN